MNLHDTLARAAGPDDAGFDHHDVQRRVADRRRTRVRRRVGAATGIVVLLGAGALGAGLDGGDDRDLVRTEVTVGEATDRDLTDRLTGSWELRDLGADSALPGLATLELQPDGTAAGTTPCGSFTAAGWTVDGGRVVFDGLEVDQHRCPYTAGAVESYLLGLLHEPLRPERWEDRYLDTAERASDGPWRTLRLTAPDGSYAAFERDVQSMGLPSIAGELPDGRAWTLTESPQHGLCVTIGAVDLGCDDVGPGIAPGADPATPRMAGDVPGGPVVLVFGHLPAGAASVAVERADGSPVDPTGLVVDTGRGLWALPLAPGDVPATVRYTDAASRQVVAFPV